MAHLEELMVWRKWAAGREEYPVTLMTDPRQFSCRKDAFRYRFTEEEGIIIGNHARSVLLGVYDYLKEIGFLFLKPGREGTRIPVVTDCGQLFREVDTKEASFYHRGVCIEGANSVEHALDFVDWLPKIGCNSFFLQFRKPDVFFERWYEHQNNPLLKKVIKSRRELDEMEESLTRAMGIRGMLDHRMGHGWTGEALGYSNTGWRREDELQEKEMALAAEIDGRRQLFKGIPANTNLCYSHPEVKRRLEELVVTYAREHPNVSYLHFWLADECNNICECDECTATTLSDQYIELLNGIDRRLTEEGLPTKIVFLLYQELLLAPMKEKLKHTDRFCLMFAPISRTFEKSYPRELPSVELPPYERNRFRLPRTLEENLSYYKIWKDKFDGDSFFYDYPLGRAHYGDFGYMKVAKIIYDDIHALKELGADGYISCQELRAGLPTTFPNYVMGESLAREEASYEEIKKSYFSALYGGSSEAVEKYLETLSGYSDMDYFNGHGLRYRPEKEGDFLKIEETAQDFLTQIPYLWEDTKEHEGTRKQLSFHANYCIRLSRALAALCSGKSEEADGLFGEFCSYIREKESDMHSVLDVYRVIEVAVKYTGFHLH
ncbi:MAG: DUF4838 domain-containing protein [Lachnospiraceae bacterium]|nr:DUF4838 domain-containing protein [Lachnospiraceae bacterium]